MMLTHNCENDCVAAKIICSYEISNCNYFQTTTTFLSQGSMILTHICEVKATIAKKKNLYVVGKKKIQFI